MRDWREQVPQPIRIRTSHKRAAVYATLALALGMSSAVFAFQESQDARDLGPCGSLEGQLKSPEMPIREVANSFSLNFDVSMPEESVPGNFYCFGRHRNGEQGDVLGVAVEDERGEHVWIVANASATSFTKAEWSRLFSDHGWDSLTETEYGWTSRASDQSKTANLWQKLAAEWRR